MRRVFTRAKDPFGTKTYNSGNAAGVNGGQSSTHQNYDPNHPTSNDYGEETPPNLSYLGGLFLCLAAPAILWFTYTMLQWRFARFRCLPLQHCVCETQSSGWALCTVAYVPSPSCVLPDNVCPPLHCVPPAPVLTAAC